MSKALDKVRAAEVKPFDGEDWQHFLEYASPVWADKFLDQWCTRAMRSRIDPMKGVARMLRSKRDLILNWFVAEGRLSSGIVEDLNNKLKLTTRISYGFRTQEAYEIVLYHNLGALPEPEFTHEFFGGGGIEDIASLGHQGVLPLVLGLHVREECREAFSQMVRLGDAQPLEADRLGSQDLESSPGQSPDLLSPSDHQRQKRRLQQSHPIHKVRRPRFPQLRQLSNTTPLLLRKTRCHP